MREDMNVHIQYALELYLDMYMARTYSFPTCVSVYEDKNMQGMFTHICCVHTVLYRKLGTSISKASKIVSIFPMLPGEASKRVRVFDGGTGSKPARLGKAQIRLPAG